MAKHGKTHEDYWKARVRRRTFRNPDGTLSEVTEWQVKLYRDGRQLWLNLGTANKVDAARAARDQWLKLKTQGWDAVKPPSLPLRAVFKRLTVWLQGHGVEDRSALHTLRKEFGTQINRSHGLAGEKTSPFLAGRSMKLSENRISKIIK